MNVTPCDHDLPGGPTIKLHSGRYINVLDPSPDDIELVDIAHALTMVCRYGGHVPSHYSVAEHSLHVSAQLLRQTGDEALALAGLFHDASEAYIGDMVRPLKHSGRLDEFHAIERRFDEAIAQRFGLTVAVDDERVREVDNQILAWEMAMVRDAPWRTPSDPAAVERSFVDQAWILREASF